MTIGGEVFSSSPLSSDFPNDDSLDIAIVKFNPTVYKHLLENGNVFLTLNNLRTIPSLTEADVLLIAGYTASKTKIDIKKKGLVFRPLLLQTAPFIKKLKSVEGNEGKTIRLEAEVIGTPKPEIEWFVFIIIKEENKIKRENIFLSFCFSGTKELKNYQKVLNIV